jgi:phosphoribosylformylglycinamidine (FGAM) synthase PurS component
MGKKRHTVEAIVAKLREAEVLMAKGQTIEEVMRQLGTSDVNDVRNFFLTFHWVGQDASPDHTKKAAIDRFSSSAVFFHLT